MNSVEIQTELVRQKLLTLRIASVPSVPFISTFLPRIFVAQCSLHLDTVSFEGSLSMCYVYHDNAKFQKFLTLGTNSKVCAFSTLCTFKSRFKVICSFNYRWIHDYEIDDSCDYTYMTDKFK